MCISFLWIELYILIQRLIFSNSNVELSNWIRGSCLDSVLSSKTAGVRCKFFKETLLIKSDAVAGTKCADLLEVVSFWFIVRKSWRVLVSSLVSSVLTPKYNLPDVLALLMNSELGSVKGVVLGVNRLNKGFKFPDWLFNELKISCLLPRSVDKL